MNLVLAYMFGVNLDANHFAVRSRATFSTAHLMPTESAGMQEKS